MCNNLINKINLNLSKKNYIFFVELTKNNIMLLKLLLKLNIIYNYTLHGNKAKIQLNYKNIKKIKNLYTPSNFKYVKYESLKKINSISINYNIIISSIYGLITLNEALKYKVGGILVCIIF